MVEPISTPQPSSNPSLLQGYEAMRPVRSSAGWTLYQASHPIHGPVTVTSLDVSDEPAESRLRMQQWLDFLRESDVPELLRPLDLEEHDGRLYVTRATPVGGRTLMEEVARKGSFSRPVVARLLVLIHSAYEALWQMVGRRIVATSLDQFWTEGTSHGQLGASLFLDAPQLILEASSKHGPPAGPPEAHFARLALTLLGHGSGPLIGASQEEFTPLPELSSSANNLLRKALEGDLGSEISLPWLLAHLTATFAGHTAVAQEIRPRLRVPEGLGEHIKVPVTRLRLMPEDKAQPILGLVAESQVWLGRSSSHSDFVAQFRPRNEANDARTRSISRAQATAIVEKGNIRLRDLSKVNLSTISGRRLNDPEEAELPLSLKLASEYPLEMRSLTAAYAPPGPKVQGWPIFPVRPEQRGSVTFRALESGVMPFELAWVFTDVTLVNDGKGTVLFDAAYAPAVIARIHHHAGSFWLEAVAVSVTARVNERPVQPNEVVPLQPDDRLVLGDRTFTVQSYTLDPLEDPASLR